ncbi:hypothetical protein IV203_033902 [Nitzschia inconspicua]|uniref:Uncharacterized protein n=1 Tax=Nitzschia inconspicua TaxID=303405 RepID=A0A9K3M2P9_9STRA|nr:hypothetical protein IV203_033902 [Nitzschia inconspicua]
MTSTISETPSFRSSDPPGPHLTLPMPPPEGESSTIVPIPPLQGQRIPTGLLRDLVRPLYPPGTSLDTQLLFNFRVKLKRMLTRGEIDLSSHTVTDDDEADLMGMTSDLDYQKSPEFLTEALASFQELLKDTLEDQNEVQKIFHYLNQLAARDPTFAYRVGTAADGTVTGFVWQTGVMRRDFELYGDVLFVDCMGKSINNKGWPINTIAMLDGEKRVCLPCEGLTISETIDGYVWLIESVAAMAPGRKLCDVKFIIGDGIFASETVLSKLGINDTCHLILDHHHLLSEDIGAWPKAFGLSLFSLLKDDLRVMVKSADESQYNEAYHRIKAKLYQQPYRKHSDYFETKINDRRHLFANHIIKRFPGHLDYQGNAPAEVNHASIVASMTMDD